MRKNIKKEIWLLISGFGIMFAVFSWLQESDIISRDLSYLKRYLCINNWYFVISFLEKVCSCFALVINFKV